MLLLEWLIREYPTAKRQTLRRMVQEGRVSINGQPARSLKAAVGQKDEVRVMRREAPPPPSVEPLAVVHEDEDVLVVVKPAGLLTSTVARERRPTAFGIVRQYVEKREPSARVGIVHRLDRDASGLLVFSKNHLAHRSLKAQFFEHSVQRVYTAIVRGHPRPEKGKVESSLVELPDGSVRSSLGPTAQEAVTEYEVVREAGDFSVLRLTLQTGRKHQIRVHLSERAWPVVGDPVYGKGGAAKMRQKPETAAGGRLMLAATLLAFTHPRTGQRQVFETPVPPEFEEFLAAAVNPGSGPGPAGSAGTG